MRITAAVVRQPGQPFVIEEIDLDEPRTHEVIVRVGSSGICHTELATRDGDYKVPMACVLDHEGAGVVEED
jgi:aryl-alcohol dehydrogenase